MTKAKQFRLVVDARQQQTDPAGWYEDAMDIPGTFAGEGFEVEVDNAVQFPFGDFFIQRRYSAELAERIDAKWDTFVVVESKTWDDLIHSVRDNGAGRVDGRLRHQLAGLLELRDDGLIPVVMIVGTRTEVGGVGGRGKRGLNVTIKGKRVKRSYTWHETEAVKAAINRIGVLTYEAPTMNDVPHTLAKIAALVAHDEHFQDQGLAPVARMGERLSFLATVLTAVEGIGAGTASIIADRYKTFARFMDEGTEQDLVQVHDVGKVTAAKVYRAFHGYDVDVVVSVRVSELNKPEVDSQPMLSAVPEF